MIVGSGEDVQPNTDIVRYGQTNVVITSTDYHG